MAFLNSDYEGSNQEEYSKILDEMSDLVDLFINKLNFNAESDCVTSGEIVITGINKDPAIKVFKDSITGYLVNFSIQETDDFNYCEVVC